MRGLWIGFSAVSWGATAHAAPWTRESGEGYGRLAVAGERVSGLDAVRYDAYGEYGLTKNWTVTAKAELVTFPENTDFNADGFRMTVRRALLRRETFVLSAEIGPVYGAAIGGVEGCDTLGVETRLGAGLSGRRQDRDWFLFADGARREHAEGCWRDRIEFGGGAEITKNVFFVNQFWLERGSEEARSDKSETGLLYRQGRIDWSLAYRKELSGRFNEEGVVASIAVRF